MLIDKEYPATHSMSTAWYIVDEDGNVGIMNFEDCGPVPLGVPSDQITSDLVESLFPYLTPKQKELIQKHWDKYERFNNMNNDEYFLSPLFLFSQDYESEIYKCQEKTTKTSEPINIKQLPKELADKFLKLPINFLKTDKFQIAEYYNSKIEGFNDLLSDNYAYSLVEFTNGKEGYVLNYSYECCGTIPTVLFFSSEGYPQTAPTGLLPELYDYTFFMSYLADFGRNEFSRYEQNKCYKKYLPTFEKFVSVLKPKLIIVQYYMKNKFEKTYQIDDHLVKIGAESYPIYFTPELKTNRERVISFAQEKPNIDDMPQIIY